MNGVLTTCGFCSCGCALYIEVSNGCIKGLFPSVNHPVSTGRLCIKGWSLTSSITCADRLRTPLIRRGSSLEPGSWDEAISLTVSALRKSSSNFGVKSLGVIGSAKMTNEECYSLVKFARSVLGTPNIDGSCRFYDASLIQALLQTTGIPASEIEISAIAKARSILIVGANVRDQLPHIGSRIEEAVRNGCQVVAADPRTFTIAPHVRLFLHPRPGKDLAWIRALLKTIIDRKLYHEDVPKMSGFSELCSSLNGVAMDRLNDETGVDPTLVAEAAKVLTEKSPPVVMFGLGVLQQSNSTEIVKALANIALLLGGSVIPLRGHNNAQGSSDLGMAHDFLPGYAPLSDSEAMRAWEQAWDCPLPQLPGLSAPDMIRACEAGDIKSLLVFGENLVLSAPDPRKTVSALEHLDFLGVSELYYTETAALADVVFPACSFLEKDGTFTNIERRVQRVRKVLEPLGEAKSDLWILAELASVLGKSISRDPVEVLAEVSAHVSQYADVSYQGLDEAWGRPWQSNGAKRKFAPVNGHSGGRDPEYPFQLIASRIHFHQQTGTMSLRSPVLSREYPEAFAELNGEDAKKLGLRPGSLITISSRSGSLARNLLLNDSLPQGCIHVPNFFAGDSPNRLASYECDPSSGVPIYKGCAVKVEAVK